MRPLLWFKFQDMNRHVWSVWLAVPRQVADFADPDATKGNYGLTFYDSRELFINALYSEREQYIALVHEIGHACCSTSGVEFVDTEEEKFVEAIDTPLTHVLRGLGLKWPARPRGWRTLRTYEKRKATE